MYCENVYELIWYLTVFRHSVVICIRIIRYVNSKISKNITSINVIGIHLLLTYIDRQACLCGQGICQLNIVNRKRVKSGGTFVLASRTGNSTWCGIKAVRNFPFTEKERNLSLISDALYRLRYKNRCGGSHTNVFNCQEETQLLKNCVEMPLCRPV